MDRRVRWQIEKWIEFAQDDLRVAEICFNDQVYTISCFHCQQAVEKLLKAVWLKEFGKVPKTHSLERLRLELEKINTSWQDQKEETRFLDQFYTPVRYPDALPGSLPEGFPDRKDTERALQIAKAIFEFSKGILK